MPGRKGVMDTDRSKLGQRPRTKTSRVKPTSNVSPNLDKLLPELKAYVWKYESERNEEKQGWEWRKPARSPELGKHRKIRWSEEHFEKDRHLWGTFEKAYRAYEKCSYNLQGVGFLVEPCRPIVIDGELVYVVWIDLDGCRSAETGEIEPWAIRFLQDLGTYAENSPSGEGIRIIGTITEPRNIGCWIYTLDGKEFSYWRDVPESKRDGYRRVEIYGANARGRHLITFTGVPLEGHNRPVRDIQEWIDGAIPPKEHVAEDLNIDPEPLDTSDEEILRVMLTSKDGRLIEQLIAGDRRLWKGEGAKYESRSQADQGFMRKLAFYTRGDKERIRRIALSSKMRREKWNREGYLDDTIERGIKSCQGNFYDPGYSSKDDLLKKFFGIWVRLDAYKLRRSLGALLAILNGHGQYTRKGFIVKAHGDEYPFPEEGLWAYASLRDLAIWMGEGGVANVSRAMKTLRKEGLALRISKGRGSKGSLYLLPTSVLSCYPPEETQDSDIQHRRETQVIYPEQETCVSLLCCKGDAETYLELVWIQKPKDGNRGLTNEQKFLLELVLFGGTRGVKELVEFLGKREDNLRRKVVEPVVEMGLLDWDGEEFLKLPEGFEETLHEIFVESGGEEALTDTQEKFRKDREEYREKGEEANEEGRESEAEKRQAAVLRGELPWDEMPSQWEVLKAYVSKV